ncbi:MAG TPA: hypothetical protein VIC34_10815 [Croceibacterium sp.]|jgi:hypothetical protein
MTAPATIAAPRAAHRFRPSFFFWMILIMCAFVFGGFGMSYLVPMSEGTFKPAPPIVHLHGVIMMSWMILLAVQAGLVGAGNVKLHRSLGTWLIAHGSVAISLGLLLQLIATRSAMDKGFAPGTDGLYLGLNAFFGFALMFTLAIRNTRRPQIHKRMMLFAMLPVLPPGVNRFWSHAFGLAPIPVVPLYLTLWSLAAAILLHEWRRTGRISRYSLFGAGWIVVEGVMHKLVVHSPPFDHFAAGLLGLVHYR